MEGFFESSGPTILQSPRAPGPGFALSGHGGHGHPRKPRDRHEIRPYGHVVVDKCHDVFAVGFEAVACASKARYVLGLSATAAWKDGHHSIIFMQCGPVRHRVDVRKGPRLDLSIAMSSFDAPSSVLRAAVPTKRLRSKSYKSYTRV